MSLPLIGPSTGWLSAKMSPLLGVHREILIKSGATAAEMCWGGEERVTAMRSESLINDNLTLPYLSLHLPAVSTRSPHDRAELQRDIAEVIKRNRIDGASVHPDTMDDAAYTALKSLGVPAAIENMDRLKASGKTADEVTRLCSKFALKGVVDLQHAYENCVDAVESDTKLSFELAKALSAREGISHFHLSGEITEAGVQKACHASLLDATNVDAIIRAMRKMKEIFEKLPPIILEGDYLPELEVGFVPRDEAEVQELIERAADRIRHERELVLDRLGY